MPKFLSFLRFVEFDDNINIFHLMTEQWKKKEENSDSEDDNGQQVFKADNIKPQSVALERRVFLSIKSLCQVALDKYPNSLEKDYELLKLDSLTFNERNCVLFRSGEKEILHFLIEFSDYVLNLLSMTFKDAKKTTQTLPEKFDSTRDFLQGQLIPLLTK